MLLNNILLILTVFSLFSCGLDASKTKRSRSKSVPGEAEQNPQPQKPEPDQSYEDESRDGLSLKSRLRIKDVDRLERDLTSALELSTEDLCKELQTLTCTRDVHNLSLGGVDAYDKSIFTSPGEVMATSPLVIERIVISACQKRVDQDYAGASVVFGMSRSTEESVEELFGRAFLREPSDEDFQGANDLKQELTAAGMNDRDWAVIQCAAVFTSSEFLFY